MIVVPRPAVFDGMGEAFTDVLGNIDCLFTINGVQAPAPVRGILRQRRAIDLGVEDGQSVEGTRHTLAVKAEDCPGLLSGRDKVEIAGTVFGVGNFEDDGRAMRRFVLDGDI